ncbi:MAG: molybdopterin biosynthesis protein MoeB, partial [Gammaproteobacteria bacterium]|nr:molybdopterin biosynthesis protein MoeB [Gammaproteobacteria bacterium]
MSEPAPPDNNDPIAALRARVVEIGVADAARLQQQGALLVDVREQDEIAQGSPPGARRPGRSFLELQIGQLAQPDQTVLVICGSGKRSLFAAASLADLGYEDVRSVAGGVQAWKAADLPLEIPPLSDPRQRERYARHLLLPEIGADGQ